MHTVIKLAENTEYPSNKELWEDYSFEKEKTYHEKRKFLFQDKNFIKNILGKIIPEDYQGLDRFVARKNWSPKPKLKVGLKNRTTQPKTPKGDRSGRGC